MTKKNEYFEDFSLLFLLIFQEMMQVSLLTTQVPICYENIPPPFFKFFFFLYAHRVPCFFMISFCNELLRMWLAIFEIWCYTQSLPVLLKVKRNENIDASFECLKQKCPRMCTQIISNQFFEDAKPIKRQILPNDFYVFFKYQ